MLQRETIHPHGKRPKAASLVNVPFVRQRGDTSFFLSSADSDIIPNILESNPQ